MSGRLAGGQVVDEKAGDLVVAAHLVLELEHVVTFVLEDQEVDLLALAAQIFYDVAGLDLADARIVVALDDEERAGQLVRGRWRASWATSASRSFSGWPIDR